MKKVYSFFSLILFMSACGEETYVVPPQPGEGSVVFNMSSSWDESNSYTVEVGLHIGHDFYGAKPMEMLFDSVFTIPLDSIPKSPSMVTIEREFTVADKKNEGIIASYAFNIYNGSSLVYSMARNGYWNKKNPLIFNILF